MKRLSWWRSSRRTLAVPVLAAGAIASVHVVSSSGGGSFTNVQAAVNAAVDGDVILVRPGTYPGFVVTGKGLVVAGDGALTPQFTGPIQVIDTRAGEDVVLQNLSVSLSGWVFDAAIEAYGCEGEVRVERCTLRGNDQFGGGPTPAVFVSRNAGGVAISRSSLRGGDAFNGVGGIGYTGHDGGDGMLVEDTRAAIHDCTLTGGRGGVDAYGGDGGQGLRTLDLMPTFATGVVVSRSTLRGGTGGDSNETLPHWAYPGDGGDGIHAGVGTDAQLVGVDSAGGAPGIGIYCLPDVPGVPGQPFGGPGSFYPTIVPPVSLDAAALVRENAAAHLVVEGHPFDDVFLMVSNVPTFVPVPSWRGVQLANGPGPTRTWILGTLDASGRLDVSWTQPSLRNGIASKTTFVQVYARNATSGVTLGGFATVTVLDSIY